MSPSILPQEPVPSTGNPTSTITGTSAVSGTMHQKEDLSSRYARLHALWTTAGQGHVFTFYPSLSESEQHALLDQLDGIDVERVNRIFEGSIQAEKKEKEIQAQARARAAQAQSSKAPTGALNVQTGSLNGHVVANGNGHSQIQEATTTVNGHSHTEESLANGHQVPRGGVDEHEIRPLPSDACATIVPVSALSPTSPTKTSHQLIHGTATTPPPESDDEEYSLGPAPRWHALGLDAIRQNRVAVLLMAGGQGTRLGSTSPKGCYDLKLPSGKSLFQLQAERIRKLQQIAATHHHKSKRHPTTTTTIPRTPTAGQVNGSHDHQDNGNAEDADQQEVTIPWYVMTSGPTRKETEQFFEQKNYFGLNKKDVVFFDQGVLPALSNEGKIMLANKSSVAVSPDGNGGLYAAIRKPLDPSNRDSSSVLADMKRRGIAFIHAYCVDNCLVRVADPVFLGYCIEREAACGAKVVRKEQPHESVGVLATRGGRFSVVEYSELSRDKAEERDPATGELAYRAANIANHFYTLPFLVSTEEMERKMAFHIARKKIPTVDLSSGEPLKPEEPNGMKLEMFVFDVFPFTNDLGVLEVERREEFSPLKNAPGTKSDNPETSRRDLLAQQRRWLIAAGARLAEGVEIEISPLLSYAGEGLDGARDRVFTKSGNLETL